MQEKANLARIRDNQRRSRARRKEYLQELEGKFRNCELLGVEASSEIQAAARRVAEENKLLRLLLQQRGVPESEIDDYIGSRSTDSPQDPNRPTALDSMLSARKPCSGEKPGCTSSPHPSMSSASSVHSKPISTSPPGTLGSSAHGQHRAMAWPGMSMAPSNQPYPNPDMLYGADDFARTDSEYRQAASENWSGPVNYEFTEAINADADTSSCTFATNIITDMRTDISPEQVKAELGCAPNTDCKVDNSTLFSVMDRYSGHLGP